MPQEPKNAKVVIDAGPLSHAPVSEADRERRAKFEAAKNDVMSKHAKLLKKLALMEKQEREQERPR